MIRDMGSMIHDLNRSPESAPPDGQSAHPSRGNTVSFLRRRNEPHMIRHLFHMAFGIFLTFAYLVVVPTKSVFTLVFGVCTSGVLLLEVLRLRSRNLNRKFLRDLWLILRRDEVTRISSGSFFMMGVFLTSALFPGPIFVMALLFLTFGDPIAAVVGKRFGRRRMFGVRKATDAGTLACFLVCMTVALITAAAYGLFPRHLLVPFAVAAGAVGALAELVRVPYLDDNFTFPVLSATFLWGLGFLF